MPTFKPPDNFNFSNPQEWGEWRQRFLRFRVASKLDKEDGCVQVSSLIYSMGKEAEKIYSSFTFDDVDSNNEDDPEDDFDTVLRKFDEHFIPKRNLIHERAKFHSRNQKNGESVEEYVRVLYELSEHAEFKEKEETIRDRLVLGLQDKEVSQRLQLEPTLTLKTAIDTARHYELVKSQVCTQRQQEVDVVNRPSSSNKKSSFPPKFRGGKERKSDKTSQQHQTQSCGKCGRNHAKYNCPAKGKVCRKCSKLNHFAAVCRSSNVNEVTDTGRQTFFLGAMTDDSTAKTLKHCDDSEPPWRVTLNLGGRAVSFKIDTGADVSIIPKTQYNRLSPRPKLKATNAFLLSPGGKIHCAGEFLAIIRYNERLYRFRLFVIDNDTDCLLSRDVAMRLGLVTRNRVDTANIAFGDVGPVPIQCNPVKIMLTDNAQPYSVNTARRIPLPLMSAVETEIKRMEKIGVIEKIKEPTDWCAPMVPVRKKGGGIRICVDLKKLNQAVKRERYLLPTIDDILHKLSKSKVFSKLDATSGFWQIPLEKESAKLTTFITPFGRYYFKRLCFGITSAPEIFQRTMEEILKDIEGVECFMDDVLLHTEDQESHDKLKQEVFARIQKVGLKLNKDKCEFDRKEITFLGHIINGNGIRPDQSKVKAIHDMPEPVNVTELRRFLGMVNYLGRYIPNLSSILKPLNDLLNKDIHWVWTAAQSQAFCEVKRQLSSAPTLAYFDLSKPVVVSADASSYGLGGVLLQNEGETLKPVAYCSRTLTKTERNYAQIEKELLASVWACEKFERYLVGQPSFTLLTDHKPLVPLVNTKDLNNTPVRCQRMLLRLLRYNAMAKYTPGKNMVVADSLSRNPVEDEDSDFEKEVEAHIAAVRMSWAASDSKLEDIRKKSLNDPTISAALEYTKAGWPKFIQNTKTEARELHAVASELSEFNGLLVRGSRIVIPKEMRREMLQRIHDGHLGIQKCRERANSSIWWPGMNSEIQDIIKKCHHCQRNYPAQRSEPLITTDLPERPFQKVAADLCHFKGNNYLVMIDCFSRYLEVIFLPDISTDTLICKIKNVFARFGIPEVIVTDNGRQFTAERFQNFAKNWGFKHITSSPYYPQSNGQAERAVQTAKKILTQDDPFLALLSYRSTATSPTGMSPAELVFGRRIRTTLPTLPSNLEQKTYDRTKVAAKDLRSKQQNKRAFDRRHGAKELPELQPGQQVLQKSGPGWNDPAVVKEQCAPRSYIIQTSDGQEYRRNRKHLQMYNQSSPAAKVTNQPTDMEPSPTSPLIIRHGRLETTPEPELTQIPRGLNSDCPPEHGVTSDLDSGTVTTTRSGRVVKTPARYKD